MKLTFIVSALLLLPSGIFAATSYNSSLGTADTFAVLGNSTVTNTGPSDVRGDLGVWSGTAITGFPPGGVTGTTHAGDAVAHQAHDDLVSANGIAMSQTCGTNLTGQDLGGLTLNPGIYCFGSSAQLTGILTLNAQGDPHAQFLFQIGSTLTTASASSVVFINGGQGGGLFWQVGSSATLGTGTEFAGNILATASITLTTGANITCGRALAIGGAVTMDTNTVSTDSVGCLSTNVEGVPEPSSASLFLLMGLPGLFLLWRKKRIRF